MRLIVFLFSALHLTAQIAQPKEPSVADPSLAEVRTPELKTAGKLLEFGARLTLASGKKLTGAILLPADNFSCRVMADGIQYDSVILITNLSSIRFKHWKPASLKSADADFHPSEAEIIFKNRLSVATVKNLSLLSKFSWRDIRGQAVVYTWYIDRWKKGRWEISKMNKKNAVTEHPHASCAVEIEFVTVEK